jgi:hypothetical protein
MNELLIPELHRLVPPAERYLLSLPAARLAMRAADPRGERVALLGIGMVEKWAPDDLRRKGEIEVRMTAYGATPQEAAAYALRRLARRGITPSEIRLARNAVVNNGLIDYNGGLTGVSAPTVYSNANAKIAVGDTAGATVLTDVDLHAAAAAGNRRIEAMDATFPTVATGIATWRSTYATGVANFAWQEWAVTNTGAVGFGALTRILNRAASSLGTKTSAQSWQFTVTITLA